MAIQEYPYKSSHILLEAGNTGISSWNLSKAYQQTTSIEQQFPVPQRRMFPTTLRKDHWVPLVHAIFPTHLIANHIYKRLLDHRAWRLTSPPALSQLSKPKKERNQEALNQVPTSIADLAHVTKDIEGKMILNWDRVEEKNWAKEWSNNIWHCPQGFQLKRGYRIEGYRFPTIDQKVQHELGWNATGQPPRDLSEAVARHKAIWEKMHAKTLRRLRRK